MLDNGFSRMLVGTIRIVRDYVRSRRNSKAFLVVAGYKGPARISSGT
jgi:hypothetical protein